MTKMTLVGISVLSSVLASGLTFFVLDAKRLDAQPMAKAIEARAESEPTTVASQSLPTRLENRIDATVDRLEKADDAKKQQLDDNPPLSLEEEIALVLEAVSGLERSHVEESYDPTWAPEARRSISDSLDELAAQRHFQVSDIDCRSRRCRIGLAWDDFESARDEVSMLGEHPIAGLNCSQSVWAIPPDDAHERYETQMYIDCTTPNSEPEQPND